MAYPCGICTNETTGTRALLCRTCDVWYHAECEDVSKTVFNVLDKNRNLAYTCIKCIENPKNPSEKEDDFKREMLKEFADLKKSFSAHSDDMKNEQATIKSSLESVVTEIRAELSSNLKEIKDEVANCKALVHSNDVSNARKFYELELQNHALQHRLNRADIVITGLATDLKNLNDTVTSIWTHLKVDIVPGDVLNVMYIKKSTAILVKFGLIAKRDKIMSVYHKAKSLKVSDVVGGSNEGRVYLNDNYSTLANKLSRSCWKLKKETKVKSYSIINREMLRVKITMLNDVVKLINIQEYMDLFNLNI